MLVAPLMASPLARLGLEEAQPELAALEGPLAGPAAQAVTRVSDAAAQARPEQGRNEAPRRVAQAARADAPERAGREAAPMTVSVDCAPGGCVVQSGLELTLVGGEPAPARGPRVGAEARRR